MEQSTHLGGLHLIHDCSKPVKGCSVCGLSVREVRGSCHRRIVITANELLAKF